MKVDPRDFSNIVPEDTYRAVCTKLTKKVTTTGKRAGYFTFQIVEGALAKRVAVAQLIADEATLWKCNELHRAVTGEDLPASEDIDPDQFLDSLFEAATGQEILIIVHHRDYEGQTRLELNFRPL